MITQRQTKSLLSVSGQCISHVRLKVDALTFCSFAHHVQWSKSHMKAQFFPEYLWLLITSRWDCPALNTYKIGIYICLTYLWFYMHWFLVVYFYMDLFLKTYIQRYVMKFGFKNTKEKYARQLTDKYYVCTVNTTWKFVFTGIYFYISWHVRHVLSTDL